MDDAEGERLYNRCMSAIRRYWAFLLAAALIPLLFFLAVLQTNWIREMGERERFRLAQGLHSAAGSLAGALQNELIILPAVFGLEEHQVREAWAGGDWSAFVGRWHLWKEYALDASILSELYLRRTIDGPPARFEYRRWDGASFEPISEDALPPESELYSFPLPFAARRENNAPFRMLIHLDDVEVTEKLIPILADRFLFGRSDYYFRVLDTRDGKVVYRSDPKAENDSFAAADLRYPLFRNDFRIFPDRVPEDSAGDPASPPGVNILRLRRITSSAQGDADRQAELFIARRRPPEYDSADNARWVLEAVHRAGSLSAAVGRATVRNTIVSSGILVLLAAALAVLSAAARRSQDLAERQREFIASITHELKTPIAVIRSAADNLAGGIVRNGDKAVKYGETIRSEGAKLTDMIDSLLVYSRIGDGRIRSSEALKTDELVRRVVERYRPELESAGFRTELMVPPGETISGDLSALELALGNLVANVLKHGREGAFLGIDQRIEKNKTGRWLLLTVRDRGPGIRRGERRLIFEAFYRGKDARTLQRPGSGLGLSLVRRIAEAHGGTVRCGNIGDLGAAFTLRLPAENQRAEP